MDIKEKDKLIKLLNSKDKSVFQLGLSLLKNSISREDFLGFIIRYSHFNRTAKVERRYLSIHEIEFISYLDISNNYSNLGQGIHKYSFLEYIKILIDNIYDNS